MPNQWFYLKSSEQIGPYDGEQLHELIAAGLISRETLLWTDGMPEWLPAVQIENLFPEEAMLPVPASEPAPSAAPNSSNHFDVGQEAERNYPYVSITRASFLKYLIFAIILPAIGVIIWLGTSVAVPEEALTPEGSMDGHEGLMILLFVGIGVASISTIIGIILNLIYLHRAWRILQPSGHAITTPGKAVGFLFIPFFNLYWIFVAYNGFANNWNRVMPSYTDTRDAPQMTSGLFLSYGICRILLPIVAPLLLAIVILELCKAINYFAARPRKASATGSVGGGGIRLY